MTSRLSIKRCNDCLLILFDYAPVGGPRKRATYCGDVRPRQGFTRQRVAAARSRKIDHYYWLTAYLAARDMQTAACRVVATTIWCLGALPLTLMGTVTLVSVGDLGGFVG